MPKIETSISNPTTVKISKPTAKALRILAATLERPVQDMADEALGLYLSIPPDQVADVEDFIRELSLPKDLSTKFQKPLRREKKRA